MTARCRRFAYSPGAAAFVNVRCGRPASHVQEYAGCLLFPLCGRCADAGGANDDVRPIGPGDAEALLVQGVLES